MAKPKILLSCHLLQAFPKAQRGHPESLSSSATLTLHIHGSSVFLSPPSFHQKNFPLTILQHTPKLGGFLNFPYSSMILQSDFLFPSSFNYNSMRGLPKSKFPALLALTKASTWNLNMSPIVIHYPSHEPVPNTVAPKFFQNHPQLFMVIHDPNLCILLYSAFKI